MKLSFYLASLATATRVIDDDEYQIPSERALSPTKIHTIDRYEFEPGAGDYEIFLPIDDDTWGEHNTQLAGYVEKVNFVERGRSFEEVDDLVLIQSWASLEHARAPDFGEPSGECNDLYPKDDPWVFARSYETDLNYQYTMVDKCGADGCFVNVMELTTPNCRQFLESFDTLMHAYFGEQSNILNVTIGHLADDECSTGEVQMFWLEQWQSPLDYDNSLTDGKRNELLGELLSSQNDHTFYPASQAGFTIVNILSGKNPDGNSASTLISFSSMLSLLLFG